MKENKGGKSRRKRGLTLTVDLRLKDIHDEQLPNAVLHVFDTSGRLLATANAPAEDEGRVSLELPRELAGHPVRVMLGPRTADPQDLDHGIPAWMETSLRNAGEYPDQPTRIALERLGATSRTVRLAADETRIRWDIYPADWQRWFTCQCVVRGRLVKQVPLPDGTVQDWGVCHACVLIYDVDAFPLIIARLPDHDIYRLRDDLLHAVREVPRKPPRRWPDPPPPPPPPVMNRALAGPAPQVGGAAADAAVGAAPGLESLTLAASATQLRQVMIAEIDWILPIICAWPWFMSWFSEELLTCVMTDDRGYFETTVTYPCLGDHPDLYFRAVQCIDGTLHVLYDPGLRCHIHWNYPCGTEVRLVTDDPAALVCAPPEDIDLPPGVSTWVLVSRIGGVIIDTIGDDGLVGYDFVEPDGTVSATGAPFGGRLGFRISHSTDIPTNALRHYRWQYSKDGDVDVAGDQVWHDFSVPAVRSVGRHYADLDETQPHLPPTFPIYTLGPKGVDGQNLYEFRPQPLELQAQAPANHIWQWPVEAVGNDIYSGRLVTTQLPGGAADAEGLYWFRLQVYDDAGTLVEPGPGSFEFVVLTSEAGDTRLPLPGEIDRGGFVFALHLDNRRCEAVIDAPRIGAVGADPLCGFLRFSAGDLVTLDFHALQPHTDYIFPPTRLPTDRATFRFWIRRGANVIKRAQPDPMNPVIRMECAAGSAGAWTGDHDGNFTAAFTPGDLLDTCKQAAFAEILRVHAKATNGWRRLDEYDAGDEWAFALTADTSGAGPGSS